MASREEAVLAFLIAVMACILLFLVMLPSQRFMEHFNAAVEAAGGLIPMGTTTTTTTSTTESTTTSTSTTSTSTSTTLSGRRCESESDCGGVVSELKCKGNTVYNYTTAYRCRSPGTEYSLCVGKSKSEPVDKCELYEDCVDGRCLRLYSNECDYLCEFEGYEWYYCRDGNCSAGDVRLDVSECSAAGATCCCAADTTTTSTTTTSTSTTTTTLL